MQIDAAQRELLLADRAPPYDTSATFTAARRAAWGADVYYCADEAAVCLIHRVALAVPVAVRDNADGAEIIVPVSPQRRRR